MLLTADIAGDGLLQTLALPPLDCDGILAPHHGSSRSNPPGLAQWSNAEWVVVSGTADADGIVRGWFDGKFAVEHTDVILRSTDFPKMKFNQFLMAPYFGPGLLPHAQKLWLDDMVVSTKRIGPLPPERITDK